MLDIIYGAECNLFTDDSHQSFNLHQDEVAEWLRRWTANPMCSARVGSNPILVELFLLYSKISEHNLFFCLDKNMASILIATDLINRIFLCFQVH